jgi:1,4-alpha-glucan branching enzyme
LLLLCPQVPMIFMGEEDASETPFLYFTDHHGALADAVRDGRRREFAGFKGFAEGQDASRIPDPNDAAVFAQSRPRPHPERAAARRRLYSELLSLRARALMPRLTGARSLGATAIGPSAVLARWRMGDGAVLTIATNLGTAPCAVASPPGPLVHESRQGAAAQIRDGYLPAATTAVFLESAGRP